MTEPSPDNILAELRVEIDRIDASVHALLMERGQIIDRLIEVKGRQGGGSAFRPGREATMMRRLLSRHKGLLPLDTIEGIWRIIISTFTFVQAKYSVHADCSAGDVAMRDSVRFHFGFTVPFINHGGAGEVIDAVGRSDGDLGLIRLDGGATAGAWWSQLIPPLAPKIIARLPLVDRPDHPAGLPVFAISKPLAEAASREVYIHAAVIDRWNPRIPEAMKRTGASILATAAEGIGLSIMLSAPGEVSAMNLRAEFLEAGVSDVRIHEIGSHAAVYEIATTNESSRVAA